MARAVPEVMMAQESIYDAMPLTTATYQGLGCFLTRVYIILSLFLRVTA